MSLAGLGAIASLVRSGARKNPDGIIIRPSADPPTTQKPKKPRAAACRAQRWVLDLVLQRVQVDRIGHARITNNGVGAEDETARRCNEAAAPDSKTVTIERAALAQAGVVTYFFQGHFRRARPCSPGETNLSNDAGQVRHDPGQAG